MSVLNEICAKKREHIAAKKKEISLQELKRKIAFQSPPRGFINAIKNGKPPAVIAEVKKASPSAGVIRADFDAVEIARIYERAGAACISVLTDEPYFQGADEYLTEIKKSVALPLLRKDFMLDEYQIYESRALGADCVLLIMAALDDSQARSLYRVSTDLGMDVLVEVHDEDELTRALAFRPAMIGVNNRDLKTLKVDLSTSRKLAQKIPPGIVKISESGITGAAEIKDLQTSGFDGFLIGESLMREEDIGAALKTLLT